MNCSVPHREPPRSCPRSSRARPPVTAQEPQELLSRAQAPPCRRRWEANARLHRVVRYRGEEPPKGHLCQGACSAALGAAGNGGPKTSCPGGQRSPGAHRAAMRLRGSRARGQIDEWHATATSTGSRGSREGSRILPSVGTANSGHGRRFSLTSIAFPRREAPDVRLREG